MPQTYYDSELTGQQIEDALEAIDGVIAPENNGKVLCIVDGKISAKSASEWGAGAVLEPLSVTANGDYTPSAGVDGYDSVHVAVPNSYSTADEGKVVSNGALVAQTSRNVTQNGTYDTTENNEVVVNVQSGGSAVIQSLNVTQNGTFNPPSGVDGYAPVTVNVQGGGGGTVQPLTVTQNGEYYPPSGVDGYSPVLVNVSGGGESYAANAFQRTDFPHSEAVIIFNLASMAWTSSAESV